MVCSDCHDPHGQETGNLKEATINLLCYKCHAEKQGPFAFEHPPVRENCDDLPQSARHGGQQPAEAAGHVPLPAVPSRPLQRAETPLSANDFVGIDKPRVRQHDSRRRSASRSIPTARSATSRSTARTGSRNAADAYFTR